MNVELEAAYLSWLYSQVGSTSLKNPSRTYWRFLGQLFTNEFFWFVPNDDNRLADGLALRDDFIDETGAQPDEEWLSTGCSMLEMLVALSRRVAFIGGGDPPERFWELIRHMGIFHCSDRDYAKDSDLHFEVESALNAVIWRTYEYDGTGGLFPLQAPNKDQRSTEIWYQMSAYIIEQEEGG